MRIKVYQFLYINYFILILNLRKELDITNNMKKNLERSILFKYIIYLKDEHFEYDIKENDEKKEILKINMNLPFIGLSLITKYENELLMKRGSEFKTKEVGKNKKLNSESNIVYLDDFKRKKKSKYK
jgi:hypothetical protein